MQLWNDVFAYAKKKQCQYFVTQCWKDLEGNKQQNPWKGTVVIQCRSIDSMENCRYPGHSSSPSAAEYFVSAQVHRASVIAPFSPFCGSGSGGVEFIYYMDPRCIWNSCVMEFHFFPTQMVFVHVFGTLNLWVSIVSARCPRHHLKNFSRLSHTTHRLLISTTPFGQAALRRGFQNAASCRHQRSKYVS